MKRLLIASGLLAVMSSQALPADLDGSLKDNPAGYADSPRANWSGLWVAALGGYEIANSEIDFDFQKVRSNEVEKVAVGGADGGFGINLDGLGQQGLFGELQLGYDHQISQNVVVGAFGGINANDAEFSLDASAFGETANLLSFEQEWGGVLGLRLGVPRSEHTLFYLAGGWAFGELSQVTSDGEAVFDNQETDLSGWFGEVGMETRMPELGNNVFLTVAGRYTDYGAITLDSDSGSCYVRYTCSHSLTLDHDVLAAMVGLKVKLGGS